MIKLIGLICCLALLGAKLAQYGLVTATFDTEMASLSDRFATGFGLANQGTGFAMGNEADTKLQKLYRDMESVLVEARRSRHLDESQCLRFYGAATV